MRILCFSTKIDSAYFIKHHDIGYFVGQRHIRLIIGRPGGIGLMSATLMQCWAQRGDRIS